MTYRNPAALEFLSNRRSHPAKMLSEPAPDGAEIERLLTLAGRTPDHGKLEPWRFVVITKPALSRLRPVLHQAVLAAGRDEADAEKSAAAFDSPLIVAVISSPVSSEKVPEWEQILSAGAVCLSLVNAALASGWGASWLTGFAALDTEFPARHLGLREGERVAGLIHIGSRGPTPPERPRPDISAKASWLT